jgi:hypothetical protein
MASETKKRLVVCAVLVARVARADDVGPGELQLPLPTESYAGVELDETDFGEAELRLRALLVYRGWFAPSLGPDSAVSGLRIELPFQHRGDTTGLGDTNLLAITGLGGSRGGAGIGVAAVLPTAAPTSLGDGTLGLGPALWAQVTATSWLDLGVLVRGLLPMTGHAPAQLKLKPAVVVTLTDVLFVTSDAEMTIAGSFHSIPVNLHAGARIGSHVQITFGPDLVVAGTDRGALTLDLEIDWFR